MGEGEEREGKKKKREGGKIRKERRDREGEDVRRG